MIHVFFVPGMFGSTVEYVLSDFTCEMTPTHAKIKFDGSMHTFLKQNHPGSSGGLVFSLREINTPLYPFTDLELPDILTRYPSRAEDSHILLYAPSVDAAEQNMLFQYHKISVGSRYGLQIFYGRDTEAEKNVRPWNQHYKSHSDMRPWEFREWFSLFYPGWIQAWQSSVDQVDHTWLKIPCSDVLNHTEHTFRKIIQFCKLTEKNGLAKFAAQWRKAQQYVIDEYDLINGIVASTVAAQPLQWRELNPIAEAIIQKKLRDLGWEIRCHDLDIFPRDSIQLYSLLESNVQITPTRKHMKKLFYMGLESYEARYTLQLTEWNRRVFERRGLDVVYVPGTTIDNTQAISVGQVLDAHGRSYFAMSQMMNLVQLMKNGEVGGQDVVYFEDMFQPGFESLGYIMNQIPREQCPRIFVRCLAQAIDPDDFVHVWGMARWMNLYEQMVNEMVAFSGGAVLATNEEMVAHMRIAGWTAPIYNISGLAFGKEEVLGRIGGKDKIRPFDSRPRRVGFAARFDQEKQPGFFMDLIEMYGQLTTQPCEFAVYSGGPLRSNNPEYIERARRMEKQGQLRIYENLKKDEYYALLNDTRVLFNCALQDWVSNTVSEADTLGCNVVYPAYRSFPETFANDPQRLYVPWSIDDAYHKIQNALHEPHHNMGLISDWNNGTVDRIIDIITGQGEQWNRSGNRYRDHAAHEKYQVVKIEE